MLSIFIILIPLIASFICLFSFFLNFRKQKYIALFSIVLCTLISILFVLKDIFFSSFQCINFIFFSDFIIPWISQLGINLHFGINRFSLFFICLTAFISIISMICNWNNKIDNIGIFYFLFLMILSGSFGIFISLDFFLLFLCLEMIFFPLYFLIIYWGNNFKTLKYRISIANKFLVYSQISSFILLFSILYLVYLNYLNTNIFTFDYIMLKNSNINFFSQLLISFGFLCSFLIKIPVVPVHSWMPEVQSCLPISNSIDILSFVLKTSIFLFLRFFLFFFPPTVISFFLPYLFILSLFTIFYSSFIAFNQNDLKKIFSYFSISHTNLLFLSLLTNQYISYQGMYVSLVSYSCSMSALLLLLGYIHIKHHTRDIFLLKDLWSHNTKLSTFFLFFIFSNIGFPMTGNFVGEFMIFLGIFNFSSVLSFLSILSTIFISIFFFRIVQIIYYGSNKFVDKPDDIDIVLFFTLIFLSLIILLIGFFPNSLLNFI